MARKIQLPDGRTLEVPDDATPEQLAALKDKLRAQYGDQPQQPDPEPAQQPQPDPQQGQPKPGMLDNFQRGADRLLSGDVSVGEGVGAFTGLGQNFGRGLDRLLGGDVSGQEAFEAFVEQPVRSFSAPVGGDYSAALGSWLVGAGFDPQKQRDRRRELAERNPTGAFAAEAAGFGGLASSLAGRGITGVVASGAGAGGIGGALSEDDMVAGGAQGAAIGAAGGALVKGGGSLIKNTGNYLTALFATGTRRTADAIDRAVAPGATKAVAQMVSQNAARTEAQAGFNVVAKRLVDADGRRVTPQQLDQVRREWVAQYGSDPTPLDLITAASARRFGRLAETKSGAQEVFADAAEARELARPGEVQRAVMGGTGRQSSDAVRRVRSEDYTRDLDRLGAQRVPMTQAVRDLVNNQDVARALGRGPTGRRMSEIASGQRPLTLRDLENIRTGLSTRANTEGALPSDMREFVALAEMAEQAANSLDGQYGQALNLFRQRSQFADGVQNVPDVLSGANTRLQQNAPAMQPYELRGAQAGARTKMAESASKSRGARRVSEDLQEAGPQENLEALLGPAEAQRLAQAGRMQQRSAQNWDEVNVAPRDRPSQRDIKAVTDVTVGASAFGRGSAGFKSNLINTAFQAIKGLGIPPGAARGAARMMVDGSPQSVQRIVDELTRAGARRESVEAIMRQITAAITAENVGEAE